MTQETLVNKADLKIPTRIMVIKSLAAGLALDLSLRDGLVLLNRRLDNDWISFKKLDGKNIAYLNKTDVSLLLDYVFNFDWTVEYATDTVGTYVVVTAKLTVFGNNGLSKTTQELGYGNLNDKDIYGGPILEATAQSLRRAAASLGLGRYLYYPNIIPPVLSNQTDPTK